MVRWTHCRLAAQSHHAAPPCDGQRNHTTAWPHTHHTTPPQATDSAVTPPFGHTQASRCSTVRRPAPPHRRRLAAHSHHAAPPCHGERTRTASWPHTCIMTLQRATATAATLLLAKLASRHSNVRRPPPPHSCLPNSPHDTPPCDGERRHTAAWRTQASRRPTVRRRASPHRRLAHTSITPPVRKRRTAPPHRRLAHTSITPPDRKRRTAPPHRRR
jgi:hypothetical protein